MTADALVLTCMDARLHRPDRPFLTDFLRGKDIRLKSWDLVAFPGGCRDLVAPEAGPRADALLHAVKTACGLHAVSSLVLINHSDCGAYGGGTAFPDVTAEYRRHAEDLRAARTLLRQRFPNVDVRLFFATAEERSGGPYLTFDEVR